LQREGVNCRRSLIKRKGKSKGPGQGKRGFRRARRPAKKEKDRRPSQRDTIRAPKSAKDEGCSAGQSSTERNSRDSTKQKDKRTSGNFPARRGSIHVGVPGQNGRVSSKIQIHLAGRGEKEIGRDVTQTRHRGLLERSTGTRERLQRTAFENGVA